MLNLTLAALAVVLTWQLRVRWTKAAEKDRTVAAQAVNAPRILPPPAVEPPKPVTAGEYVEVAQKTLFARDRNPNVIIEQPPAPPPTPPPPPMPPLPFYHGQMSLGAPVALLSLKGNDQKGYHVGDEVGPFKLVAFDRESITLDWEGKTVERKLAELRPKEPAQAEARPAGAAAPPPSAPAVVSLTGGAASAASPSAPSTPQLGNDMGNGFRGCAVGDTSPAGTVVDGYKKVMSRTAVGSSCHWELAK